MYQTNALNHLSYVRMLEPPVGFEPTTSCLQNKCSTNWAKEACCTPARIRILTKSFGEIYATITPQTLIKVTPVGLEPTTPSLKVRCSKTSWATKSFIFPNMSKNQKKTPNFVVQGPSLYIWWYDYILLRTLNLRQSCPLMVNHDWPTFVGRLLTLCVEFCFIVSY